MDSLIKEDIDKDEKRIINNMERNALSILDKAIIELSGENNDDTSIVFSAMHLQICIELYVKNYVCKVYGFENILSSKYKKIRENDMNQYINELKNFSIKTLGFNELKDFLIEKNDYFADVINNGKSLLFLGEIEYDYLAGIFDKFQNIRNAFVHLGINLKKEDIKWIKNEFYTVIIYFISTIMNKNKAKNIKNIYDDLLDNDYDVTSLDILISKLSSEARLLLDKDKEFEGELGSIAEDISSTKECFKCIDCGKDTLALNIIDSEGQTKCLYCGIAFYAAYCECTICHDDTIVYDEDNMDNNNNVMPGYCYRCEKKLKVYMCPVCGQVYSYDSEHPIHFNWECCENNFVDRYIADIDY